MINVKNVVIIDDNKDVYNELRKEFIKNPEFEFVLANSSKESIQNALETIPNLILIDSSSLKKDPLKICEFIRKSYDNSSTPILVILPKKDDDYKNEFLKRSVEFCIARPYNKLSLYYSIINISRLIDANRCISKLTGLPGNAQIEIEMKRRIASKKTYAILYVDLDNFKAYNDKYGFMNGDEVIKFTATCMREAIQEYGVKGDFLGHIGGDDFVAIVDYENSRKIGKAIVKFFDSKIKDYYSEEDVKHGFIRILNRKGKMEKYPLMTITVAMISNKVKAYKSVLEIGEESAGVKKKAKSILGSTFLVNQRRG